MHFDDEVQKKREQYVEQREKSLQKRAEIKQNLEMRNQEIRKQNLA